MSDFNAENATCADAGLGRVNLSSDQNFVEIPITLDVIAVTAVHPLSALGVG